MPGGVFFDLADTKKGVYLYHSSEIGEFFLSSDTVIPSFWRESKIADIINQIPKEEVASFNTIGYTIGGMMLFPGNKVDGKMTINGARGCHPRIKDRFDLTVECIRRHYLNIDSPLSKPIKRYSDFFELFENFRGFIEFFLLQDIVTEDFNTVKFSAPFDDFRTPPLPKSVEAYISYKKLAIDFLNARNRRIDETANYSR